MVVKARAKGPEMLSPNEKNKRPDLPLLAEEDRQLRIAKTARLRRLRHYASWLASAPDAEFHDEIDCSVLFLDKGLWPTA